MLPASELDASMTPDGFLPWYVADGREVSAASFRGRATIDTIQDSLPVVVSLLGDQPLVGRSFTDRFLVILDHGQSLIIEP